MALPLAAIGEASVDEINFGWLLSFALATVTLVLAHVLVPAARGLIVGTDGRWSTSKFQLLMWTYVIAFALFSLLYAFVIVQVVGELFGLGWGERLEAPLGGRFSDFLNTGLDESYLLLLGFPIGAAVGAKSITTLKVAGGSVVKPAKDAPEATATTPLQELTGDDQGNSDLGDYQYLLFNFLGIAYFLALFMAHPGDGLPDMPDTLVGLTGVAAAAYVAKKGVYREPPILFSVLPPQASSGQVVQVHGERLLTAPTDATDDAPASTAKTVVVIGKTPAVIVTEPAPTDELVSVKVPASVPLGPNNVRVIRPPGAESEELPFSVVDPAPIVIGVRPSRIKLGSASELAIDGEGFLAEHDSATEKSGVTLSGIPLTVEEGKWSDSRVVASLPSSDAAAAAGIDTGDLPLVIYSAEGHPSAPHTVTVES